MSVENTFKKFKPNSISLVGSNKTNNNKEEVCYTKDDVKLVSDYITSKKSEFYGLFTSPLIIFWVFSFVHAMFVLYGSSGSSTYFKVPHFLTSRFTSLRSYIKRVFVNYMLNRVSADYFESVYDRTSEHFKSQHPNDDNARLVEVYFDQFHEKLISFILDDSFFTLLLNADLKPELRKDFNQFMTGFKEPTLNKKYSKLMEEIRSYE